MRYLSLFSGMEAAHLAWAPLGWKCVGVAEIEKSACALLAHRLPDVPNLGSVTGVTQQHIAELGRIDVVIGGSPCQDLSVAGKRAGLAGERSGLFHEQIRIFDAARSLCGARWLVWENVPGAFSSHGGRDFAVVVGSMAGLKLAVPEGGWGTEGVALGPNGLVEWSVLDAQFFGLAQRRKRVFAVLDSGNWADRPPILLEPESLRGDSPPRREAGQNVAGTISARTQGGGGLGTDFDIDGGLVPAIAGNLTARIDRGGVNSEGNDGHLVPVISHCLNAGAMGRQDAESETLVVTHALRAEGFDASEDGTGRGVPLIVAFAENSRAELRLENGDGQIVGALNQGGGKPGQGTPCIAFDAWQSDVLQYGDMSGPLDTDGHTIGVQTNVGVRRLTPRECERLQGAPDDWTRFRSGNKGAPMKDGPRYKLLGNSFAVPVIRWIGGRIAAAEANAMREAA